MNKGDTKRKKRIPVGVKLISILMYIIAGFGLLIYVLGELVGGSGAHHRITTIFSIFEIRTSWTILVLFNFTMMVLFFILGRGLWEGINIARITVVVLYIVSIIGTVISVLTHRIDVSILYAFSLIVNVILRFAIIYYLTGSTASRYFSKVDSDDAK